MSDEGNSVESAIEPSKSLVCGIVRPIAAMDSYSESHWLDVHNIISDAIEKAGFKPNLVSNANEVNIIHKTIVDNLYTNEMVVCDISGKNPNVMLELGMRLAFDKPTIVIIDDMTPFSFDTSPIEHLLYPRDLRFGKIIEFKNKLTAKIKATYEKASSDPAYSTFLKHFGDFTVIKIDQKEVSKEDYVIQSIEQIKNQIDRVSMQFSMESTLNSLRSIQVNTPRVYTAILETDVDKSSFQLLKFTLEEEDYVHRVVRIASSNGFFELAEKRTPIRIEFLGEENLPMIVATVQRYCKVYSVNQKS
jgi:hypothetical protein